ncbi:hypothetical protein DRO32_03225 [Candidatus Bathyarchaeota archaeon]|nr:MAG: hypothetical protein DRO32_03225 [Candidatus Bathyarchaeota archaeon]
MELLRLGPGLNIITGSAALLLARPGHRALAVADLHIGWESTLADRGLHIPSQAGRMLSRLEKLIMALGPEMLIFLGDVKHTVAGAEAEEWAEIPAFFERLKGLVEEVVVIPGNHDGRLSSLLPEGVELAGSGGLALWGAFGLFHGHSWPSPELLECRWLITGHMHPVVLLRHGPYFRTSFRVWLVMDCDGGALAREMASRGKMTVELEPSVEKMLVMPSFNEFLGGQAVNRPRRGGELIGPVLRSGCVRLEEAEVYLLDGTFLGRVGQLRSSGL